ncbi:MAG: heparan-alpha-glucosaminide N-acetyltransferase domain-containing protein, partial [Mycetocola sp.]
MTTDPVRASAGRIAGVDIARGIAILGMFVAHTMPRDGDVELVVDGRSSLLFATLAGVSLGLLTGGEHPHDRSRRGRDRRMVLMRALLIFLLGVLLATLDSGVAVILDYYAFMFALLIPLVFLPRSVLAAIAAVLLVGAPLLADLVGRAQSSADSVVGVLQDYLLTGTYPALVWLPVLLAGLIAARSGMDRRRTQLWLIGGGVTAAVLGYGAAAVLPGVT